MTVGLILTDPTTVVDDARSAEAAGFDRIAVSEHLFHLGAAPNPYVQLAAAAGATRRIRLLSAISLLPLYAAPVAAKLAATLDLVSGGRFELGVGAGGEYPPEFHAAGVDPSTRFRRLDEALDVLQKLFTQRPASFDGEFTSLDGVSLEPPPVQTGGPPIWLGGRKSGAQRRAARFAQVWMPYMVTPMMLAETLEQVRTATVDFGRSEDDVAGAAFLFVCADDDAEWARRTGIQTVSETYGQDFEPLADRYLTLGSPGHVVDRVGQYVDAGADHIIVHVAARGDVRRRVVETLERAVLPAFRSQA